MATAPQVRPALRLVFSYAREDETLRDRLETHMSPLERAGLVRCWHDRDIRAGCDWARQIEAAIADAEVVLLLVSPDFVASDYCFTIEMRRALERHAAGSALVIPVLLRPMSIAGQPWAHLQGVPRDLRAVTLWPNQDEALACVVREVLAAIEGWSPAAPGHEAPPRTDPSPFVEERVLDAAIASSVRVGETAEVLALVRRAGSGGLRAVLEADDTYQAGPEAVRSQGFEAEFPQDALGHPLPLRMTLVLDSPDFVPARQTKQVRIPPAGDSATFVFLAAPRRPGPLGLQIELLAGDVSVVCHLLRSHGVADAVPEPLRYVVASVPLMTVSFGGALRAVEDTGAFPAPPLAAPPSPSAPPSPPAALPDRRRPPPGATRRPPDPAAATVTAPEASPRPTDAPRAEKAPPPHSPPRMAGPALATAAALLVGVGLYGFFSLSSRPQPVPPPPPPPNLDTTPEVPPVFAPAPASVLEEARARFARRDYAGTVALVERVSEPGADLNALAGRALYELGDYDRAARRFERAAEAEPAVAEHRRWAARAREASRRRPRATPTP
jgi:hypothetical protein